MKKRLRFLTVLLVLALLRPMAVEAVSAPNDSQDAAPAEDELSGADSQTSEEPPAEEAPSDTPEGSFMPVSEAQVPEDQQIIPGTAGLEERVSLDLRNIEVSDALRFLALKGGLNMAISKTVSGRVQLLLNNVPIKDILDIILITNNLAFDKVGDVYNIMTEAEYKERYGRRFADTRRVRLFKLRYAVPEQAFSVFEVLKSEIGRLLVDPESGTVLVMDSPENVARMEQALEALEQKKTVKIYRLKYAKALEVETRLKTRLDNKKVGSVTADERTNQVIVETLPDRISEIDEVVAALDQKTREVMIDAKVVKVTMTDDYAQEIKWEGLFRQMGPYGWNFIGNHPFSPLFRTGKSYADDFSKVALTANPTGTNIGSKNELTENLFFGAVGEDGFEVLLKWLKTLGETRILSNPKIAVVNNQEAKIHVGEKQAYVTTTTTTGQTTTTTAESVTFVDVGIQLSVTPNINEDGYVTMKIKPEISSVADFLVTPSGNRIPIIDSSLAETTVMVKDGISVVIGGLRKDEKIEARKKIPFLGDLPIIGGPFNSFTTKKVHTELLILITPHIVYGDKLHTGEKEAAEMPFMSYSDYNTQPAAKGAALRS